MPDGPTMWAVKHCGLEFWGCRAAFAAACSFKDADLSRCSVVTGYSALGRQVRRMVIDTDHLTGSESDHLAGYSTSNSFNWSVTPLSMAPFSCPATGSTICLLLAAIENLQYRRAAENGCRVVCTLFAYVSTPVRRVQLTPLTGNQNTQSHPEHLPHSYTLAHSYLKHQKPESQLVATQQCQPSRLESNRWTCWSALLPTLLQIFSSITVITADLQTQLKPSPTHTNDASSDSAQNFTVRAHTELHSQQMQNFTGRRAGRQCPQ
jgi:hypothetical protein